jgi:RNA polymerase sigma factor (sigma-70 family)
MASISTRPSPTCDLAALATRALDGDSTAWRSLVDRLSGVVWKVVSSYRLSAADREDAYASTFYRLYDKLATIREYAALPGWVATTARNEVHAILRSQGRVVPTDAPALREVVPGDHDSALLDDELLGKAMVAFSRLPAKRQALLRLLTAEPPLSYEEISRLLDIPLGSIGPTRGRCLEQLRLELMPYFGGG